MLLLLRLWRRQQKKRRTQKRVAFSRSHSWEHMRCDKSWKKFEKQMNSASSLCQH
jgi:ribosomal protein L32E